MAHPPDARLVCGLCWRDLADNESDTFRAHLDNDCPFMKVEFTPLPVFVPIDGPVVDWMAE